MNLVARFACICAVSVSFGSLGCVERGRYDEAMAELEAARYQAALRDQQNLAMRWQMAALTQQVMLAHAEQTHAGSAVLYVRKLEELLASNNDMAKRLESAEVMVSQLAQSQEIGAAARSKLNVTLAELRAKRLDTEKQTAAYRELLRIVQSLVDTGQVKAVLREGRVYFEMPRKLDLGDPWPPRK